MKYRITYTVSCDSTFYVDIDADNEKKAIDKFNSGYWDYDEEILIDSSCLDPEIENIQVVDEEDV
jgi:hypothetical protein